MANKANEYPKRVLCPLFDAVIEDIDCVENQDTAEGMVKPGDLPQKVKHGIDWREVCRKCKYHETD